MAMDAATKPRAETRPFDIVETTVADVHAAFKAGTLTVRQLVQMYLDRIAAYDKKGPAINAVISLNPTALEEADRLDAAFKASGFVGPLHGIPVIMKDQADITGMPTTLGSVLFKDYIPTAIASSRPSSKRPGPSSSARPRWASLEAATPTARCSARPATSTIWSVRPAARRAARAPASSANFCTVAVGQEGFASIRRPSAWNGIVGMRPTMGLVSRAGVYGGWPTVNGSLGPMTRTVADLAKLLDSMVGYDPDDPVTAHGVGKAAESYSAALDRGALKGKRMGILRESMGYASEPDSDDFAKVGEVFDKAVEELRRAGAELVDPVVIPDLKALMARRARSVADDDTMFELFFKGGNAPFATRAAAMASPLFQRVARSAHRRWTNNDSAEQHHAYLKARDTLMINLLKTMADHRLDAIVHKTVEHQPTLIKDGVNPPFVDQKARRTSTLSWRSCRPLRCRPDLPGTISRRGSPSLDGPTTTPR